MKKEQTLLQILKKDVELMHKAALALERVSKHP